MNHQLTTEQLKKYFGQALIRDSDLMTHTEKSENRFFEKQRKKNVRKVESMKIQEQLEKTQNQTNSIYNSLKTIDDNYKKKTYVVLSNKKGQCNLTSDIFQIIKDFPDALEPLEVVESVKEKTKELKKVLQAQKPSEDILNAIQEELLKIEFKSDLMVELRFNPGTLDYSFIERIFQSNIISKELTKSPLAPVLFNVREFLRKQE